MSFHGKLTTTVCFICTKGKPWCAMMCEYFKNEVKIKIRLHWTFPRNKLTYKTLNSIKNLNKFTKWMDVTVVHYQSIADFDWKCELELQKSNINEIVDYELSLSIQHGSQIKGDKSHIIYYKFCATTIALESLDVCYGNRTSIRKSDHSEQLYIHLHWPFSLWEEADTNQTSNSIKEVYNGFFTCL